MTKCVCRQVPKAFFARVCAAALGAMLLVGCPTTVDVDEGELFSAWSALEIGYAPGDGPSRVTADLTLPSSAGGGISVSWSSSLPGVVDSTGRVARSVSDATVRLTAVLGGRAGTRTKVFDVVVKALDTAAPSEVANLVVTVDDRTITLMWDDPSDADLETIVVEVGGFPLRWVEPGVGTTTYVGLSNGTAYLCTLRAVDAAGNSSSGVSVLAVPAVPDWTPPAEVVGLQAVGGARSVTLSWSPPSDPDFAAVVISVPGMADREVEASLRWSTFADLDAGSSYLFTVRSRDLAGNFSAGVVILGAPDAEPPGEVSSVSIANRDGSVIISYVEPSDPDFFAVRISAEGIDELTVADGTADLQEVWITGLSNDREYVFTLRAVDTAGNVSEGVTAAGRPIDPDFGGGTVGIGLETPGRLWVTFEPAPPSELAMGETLRAAVATNGSSPVVAWYRNGRPIEGQGSVSLSVSTSRWAPATHRISVVVVSGGRIASAFFDVIVR